MMVIGSYFPDPSSPHKSDLNITAIIIKTTVSSKMIGGASQKGAITHHHDHVMCSVNFNVMNTTPKIPANPIPPDFIFSFPSARSWLFH